MIVHNSTPEDLKITSRDLAFGRSAPTPRHWLGGDAIATAFYNALSASFPQGERFFMDSVRNFKSKADAKLQQQIVSFTTQEALHTREHVFFNQQIAGAGYDLSKLDAVIKKRLEFGRTRPKIEQLGATIALEHFTAILAHEALSNPARLELLDLLRNKGAVATYNDPHIPTLPATRHYPHLRMDSTPLTEANLAAQDCVVIVTDHAKYDWSFVASHSRLVIDTRNATRNVQAPPGRVVRA